MSDDFNPDEFNFDISDDEIKTLMESMEDTLRAYIAQGHANEVFQPRTHILCKSPDGTTQLAIGDIEITDEKEKMFFEMGRQMVREARRSEYKLGLPLAIVLVTESWYSAVPIEVKGKSEEELAEMKKEILKAHRTSPSQDPNRKEAFTIGLLTATRKTSFIMVPFDRMDDGTIQIIEDDVTRKFPTDEDKEGDTEMRVLEPFWHGALSELED